jgi:hypothetical protein
LKQIKENKHINTSQPIVIEKTHQPIVIEKTQKVDTAKSTHKNNKIYARKFYKANSIKILAQKRLAYITNNKNDSIINTIKKANKNTKKSFNLPKIYSSNFLEFKVNIRQHTKTVKTIQIPYINKGNIILSLFQITLNYNNFLNRYQLQLHFKRN